MLPIHVLLVVSSLLLPPGLAQRGEEDGKEAEADAMEIGETTWITTTPDDLYKL
jgi:hypothetical protein